MFVDSILSVALLLSGCVSPPAVDSATPPTTDSTAPEPTPSPTGTAVAQDNEGGDSNSGESTAPPTQPPAPTPTQAPTPTPTPTATATPSPDPVAPAAPALSLISQKCVSGKLTVTVTASYGSGYRKGIQSVVVERPNEYNSWIAVDATWLGQYTGQGDQWTAQPAGSKQQRFKDTLRITATADGGAKTVIQANITAPC